MSRDLWRLPGGRTEAVLTSHEAGLSSQDVLKPNGRQRPAAVIAQLADRLSLAFSFHCAASNQTSNFRIRRPLQPSS
jgi:hypothetical protein